MTQTFNQTLLSFGFLRLSLISLTLINTLIPLLTLLLTKSPDRSSDGWYIVPNLITPVMAPLLITLLLLDIIMNKVKAVDEQGARKQFYQTIGRVDMWVIFLTLLFWIPWFRTIL